MSGHLVILVLYAMYMYVYILFVRSNLSCVVRSEFVCSLCYIFHALELWYLPADVSNNFILIHVHLFFVHEFCCDYNIIVYWIKSDIHVLVLTLFPTQYYIYFAILFCFVFVKQTTSLGMAPPLLYSINLLLGSVLTCLRLCQICFNVSVKLHSLCCIHIYIGHLINDMKLESSQFIYYPKRAELLFAWVDVLSTKLYNWSSG